MAQMINICVRLSENTAKRFRLLSVRRGLPYGTLLKLALDALEDKDVRRSKAEGHASRPPKSADRPLEPLEDFTDAVKALAKEEQFGVEEKI